MTLDLGPLHRGPHLPALVASSISREIAHGRLRAGDRLPTEQALAATFGVSRNVVREAIARLRLEGLVWSRQGRGAFIADPPDHGAPGHAPEHAVLELDQGGLPVSEAFGQLLQLREILEVPAAGLAAAVRTAVDLERLEAACHAMLAAPYGSRGWLDGDLDFHRVLAATTRNPYIEQAVVVTADRVRESILAAGHRRHSDDMAQATLVEHRAIAAAVAEGDRSAAGEAMRAHLQGAARRLGLVASSAASRPRGRDAPMAAPPAADVR